MGERWREDGFGLIEVVVCVAVMIAACVAGLGVVPALAHASQEGVLRDAATTIARTAIDRARAATAYYPPGGYQPTHAYALNPSVAYAVQAHVHRGFCKPGQTFTNVAMNVHLTYDAVADAVTADVSYPRDACDVTVQREVTVTAQLTPSALAPGTTVVTPIGDPTQQ
jgi:type II secretory pathway pseudopilin PulG